MQQENRKVSLKRMEKYYALAKNEKISQPSIRSSLFRGPTP